MIEPRLVILAGGRGSRMGGDKLRLRDPDGRLLIAQWFDRLGWPVPPLLVLPPDGTAPAELAAWPTARDAVADDGPLRGVEAAISATPVDWLIVVAVDTPGVGRQQLDWLAGRRETDPSARAWMTRRGGRIEPFPLLIHRSMAAAVTRRLAEGRRSLHGLADMPAARVVDAPDWPVEVWQNLNRPEDLKAFLVPSPVVLDGRGLG